MPAKNISEDDLKLLKRLAKENIWKRDEIKKVYDLINNQKNATDIINELSGADILNLAELVNAPIYDTWSTQQKIALVKKDINVFSVFPYLSRSRTMNDQELLKECLKEFNKKHLPSERKDVYYFNFRMVFRHITFNQENLETFMKSFPEQSPFIFEEYPFNEIQNWRELIKSNPNLALENRMLDAMDEVNYFSKGNLQNFKEKYDDLLKNKIFYNHFIEKANWEIKNKIRNEEVDANEEIEAAEYYDDYKLADQIEEESNKKIEKYISSLDYITETFGPYKSYITEQELANRKKATSGVTA